MNFRLSIARKLILGFGTLGLGIVLSSMLTFTTLNKNQEINYQIIKVYTPSIDVLNRFQAQIAETKMLIKNWVTNRQTDAPDKLRLKQIQNFEFPAIKNEIITLSQQWDEAPRQTILNLLAGTSDTLFVQHLEIMTQLSNFEAYDDAMVLFEITPLVEDGGSVLVLTDRILLETNKLSKQMKERSDAKTLEMNDSFSTFNRYIIWAGIALLIIAIFTATITIRSITVPLNQVKFFLLTMSRGVLPKEQLHVDNNEIGDMAEALNNFVQALKHTANFAVELGKGEYNSQFKPLSEDDILGNSLLNMRDNLKKADEEDAKRKREDELRNWTALGLAKFGDILRQNNDNMDKLSFNIISNLVNYLNVNQGALFILNDLDPKNLHFELKAAIAFGRDKLIRKTIEMNEGLVGRCAFEKLTIYLKEIPRDYVNITSGLGGARPEFLLLVPLKLNDGVFGVIEMASFEAFEPHHIEFVEKLGENIASTISTVRINERTARLLSESQLHREELAAQEEEMRQNMEELQATQEESARREQEMREMIDAINNTIATVELDMYGNIIDSNEKFAELFKVSGSDLATKPLSGFFDEGDDTFDYEELWEKLRLGIRGQRISRYKTPNGLIWMRETYTPTKNPDGDYDKVLTLAIDISQEKIFEMQLQNTNITPLDEDQ